MEKEDHQLLRPLLLPTTTTNVTTDTEIVDFISSSNSKIILRLFSVILIGILSVWANHEASKGFEIKIQNDATNSSAGRRFELFYASNGKASRLVLNTSNFVETLLYPIIPNNSIQYSKKKVNQVTLRLASRNLTHMVDVESFEGNKFVLNLAPSIMEETKVDLAMLRAVQQGMTRVWLYDNYVPNSLMNGMVEYINSLAGLGLESDQSGSSSLELPLSDKICWMNENPRATAYFLNYCEEYKSGFIQRLNQAMKGIWHDQTLDNALGMPAQHLCALYMSESSIS